MTILVCYAERAYRQVEPLCIPFKHPKPVGGCGSSLSDSLYAWFGECVRNDVRVVGRYNVVTYADSGFLQVFIFKDSY